MKCPNCQSTEIRKHGFYRGKQRYQCKICARQFVSSPKINTLDLHSTGVEEQIDRYLHTLSTPLSGLPAQLQQATTHYPLAKMQPSWDQAQLVAMLVRSIRARRVVEIGIFSSYTTLAIALALPEGGKLISCGVTGEHLELCRTYWQQGGVADKIDFHTDSGIEMLHRLLTIDGAGSCDLIVIAALKHQYLSYYHNAIDLLRPNGMLIATDVLWQGRVLNPQVYNDEFTRGIDRFNHHLVQDERVEVMLLPCGDGLSIAVKR